MNPALAFFLILALGHVIGDFLLQPYWLVLAKRKGWHGLFIHVGMVTFITAILAWNSIPNWWVWIIVLFIGHLFIDQFRTFVFTDNTKGKGLLLLVLDQLAHFILIAILAWAAQGTQIKHTVAIESSDRIFGGMERIVGTVLILLGLGILTPLVFLPRLAMLLYSSQAQSNRSTIITKVVTSLGTALLVGFVLYNIPMPMIVGS